MNADVIVIGAGLAGLVATHELTSRGKTVMVIDQENRANLGGQAFWSFGGIFLDAVLSSKKHKTFRFGLNWVVLGIAVPIPFRTDRYYCLPVLWRLYRKKGQDGYQTRPHAAAALARRLAEANPDRTFWLVGDSAYVNAAVLQGRPVNLQVIGPLHWKAALYDRPAPRRPDQKGAPRKKGDRLPNPKAMIEDTAARIARDSPCSSIHRAPGASSTSTSRTTSSISSCDQCRLPS